MLQVAPMQIGAKATGAPPAALTFVAASNANATSGTTLVFNKPAGVASGDLMVAILGTSTGSTPTIPGWSAQYFSAGGGPSIAVLSKVASGAEPSTYTATFPSGKCAVICLAYRGGLATFDQVGVRSSYATSDPTTAPSITTSNIGTLIAVFGGDNNTTPSSGPSGMTLRNNTGSNAFSMVAYDLANSPSGATGNKTMTWTSLGVSTRTGIQLQIR